MQVLASPRRPATGAANPNQSAAEFCSLAPCLAVPSARCVDRQRALSRAPKLTNSVALVERRPRCCLLRCPRRARATRSPLSKVWSSIVVSGLRICLRRYVCPRRRSACRAVARNRDTATRAASTGAPQQTVHPALIQIDCC